MAFVVAATAAGSEPFLVTRWSALEGTASLDGGVLTMRGCCSAWGRAVLNLPTKPDWFGITVNHANTECLRLSQVRIATRFPDGGLSGGTRMIVGLNQADGSVTFKVPQDERVPLALVLETEGGLRCCGETVINSVTLTAW